MAKFYGAGVKTGKLGASVFRVRGGETIENQYQPIVFNPNTTKQIAARGRMKLMSQLAAVMAPVLMFQRKANVSSRNQFISANYGASTFENNQADVVLTEVKLTKSSVGLPSFSATRGEGLELNVTLYRTAFELNRVVYVAFAKGSDSKLRLSGSTVVTENGNGYWPGTITLSSADEEHVVYAYGVRDNTEYAKVVFGDLEVLTAETVAKLLVTRQLTESDITVTETRAAVVPIS